MGRKYKICDVCGKRFHRERENRLQIIKRLKKGKVEFWVCPDCAKDVCKTLREKHGIKIYAGSEEKSEEEQS